MRKPETNEYNPYFQHYIDLAGEGKLPQILKENTEFANTFFSSIEEGKHNFKYAPDKWTVKEVLMHIIDTERVFSYRILVCARGDNQTPLYKMDDKLYAANTDVTGRTMQSLLDEWRAVRKNAEILFENMNEEQSSFIGNAVGHPITARAIGYIIAGHMLHHISIIKERYL